MNRTDKIIKRLNLWMNYNIDNQLIDENYQFNSKLEDGNINVYHINTDYKVAKINTNLIYHMNPENYIDIENTKFNLMQYTNSLLIRILSSV
jgi:hypothetical protein